MNRCPFCSSDKGMKLLCSSRYQDEHYPMDLSLAPQHYYGKMFASQWESCARLALFDDKGADLDDNLFGKANRVYPQGMLKNRSVPMEIREIYEKANNIKNIDSDAFVLLIRKALDVTCKIHGIEKGNLGTKLAQLRDVYRLPQPVVDAADKLRPIGNRAAHDLEHTHAVNAEQVNEFFLVVMKYIYRLPSKLRFFIISMNARLRIVGAIWLIGMGSLLCKR